MKILYLSQRFPYPPNRGDRIPTFNHIKHLSRHHQVHVSSLITDADEMKHVGAFSEWAASSTVELQPMWKSFLGKVRAFFRGEPLSIGHYRNPVLHRRVRELIEREKIEAVIVFSSSMAQYVEPFTGIVRIMNFCDLDSHKWADLSKVSRWPRSWIYRREARLLLSYERKIAGSFDCSCTVTEQEAALFRRLIPGPDVRVLANGVDHEYFEAIPWNPSEIRLVFVGVMDYEPNAEAVHFFANEVWPRIRAKHPHAEFTIVGSRPNAKVRALAEKTGVRVTGQVPDVRTFLASATLVVVPLKVARGIQNKILEAMAAGVPVLTTPLAAFGISPESGNILFTAERKGPAFTAKVLELLGNPQATRDMARSAQNFVQQNFSWAHTGQVLEDIILAAKEKSKPIPVPGTGPNQPATSGASNF
ncbi:MAG: family PEP-CTERM/XrtA system glycosyltransferase [Fibrobacteres bacterium]|nr:family PEP-CTERM/XrtA system glycosyltransferase [Fibrobacterota bacterium]